MVALLFFFQAKNIFAKDRKCMLQSGIWPETVTGYSTAQDTKTKIDFQGIVMEYWEPPGTMGDVFPRRKPLLSTVWDYKSQEG